jgi:hypothetical protein
MVDTMGPWLMILDFSASVQDQDGARRLPRLPIMKRSEMISPPLISSSREGFGVTPGLRGLQSLCHAGVVLICLDNLLIISG